VNVRFSELRQFPLLAQSGSTATHAVDAVELADPGRASYFARRNMPSIASPIRLVRYSAILLYHSRRGAGGSRPAIANVADFPLWRSGCRARSWVGLPLGEDTPLCDAATLRAERG